jgi:hypothetical protein
VPDLGTCRCDKPPGLYGDGKQHACSAPPTAEDLLCDACRTGCTVMWMSSPERPWPVHVEWPRLKNDPDYKPWLRNV